ncbi:hypothetical protein ILYODFUR_029197 [Ilyodon furcidens]|uniref:Uncharacterized protein n=1 Tax=Ilyodon furcidens TaxID=33524 RepID=A0ABV0VI62_9TELE
MLFVVHDLLCKLGAGLQAAERNSLHDCRVNEEILTAACRRGDPSPVCRSCSRASLGFSSLSLSAFQGLPSLFMIWLSFTTSCRFNSVGAYLGVNEIIRLSSFSFFILS